MLEVLPGNQHNALIEFESMVDLDVAILSYIEATYPEDENFYHQLLTDVTDKQILGLIHDNPDINPIRIIVSEEDYEMADNLYYTIMESHLLDVLKYATVTNLYYFAKRALESGGLCDINVLCTRKEYVEICEHLFKDNDSLHYNIIYRELLDDKSMEIDTTGYTVIFIRHAHNLFRYNNLIGKTIYIQECLTNLDNNLYRSGNGLFPNREICELHMNANRVMIFSPYDYDYTYFINYDYPFDIRDNILEPEFLLEDEEDSIEEDGDDIIEQRILDMSSICEDIDGLLS